MAKVNALLAARMKKNQPSEKMAVLANRSAEGNLSTFSGLFRVTALTDQERDQLRLLLARYRSGEVLSEESDCHRLEQVTAEVRGIANQAAFLHGERIKRAQEILLPYQEGAFSAWLMATYGNRQTPYNFLLYYELCLELDDPLREKAESLPKQVIYALAGRPASIEEKRRFLASCPKSGREEQLALLRDTFPLPEGDGRKKAPEETIIRTIQKVVTLAVRRRRHPLPATAKRAVIVLLRQLKEALGIREEI